MESKKKNNILNSDKQIFKDGFRMVSLGCSGAGKSYSVFKWLI